MDHEQKFYLKRRRSTHANKKTMQKKHYYIISSFILQLLMQPNQVSKHKNNISDWMKVSLNQVGWTLKGIKKKICPTPPLLISQGKKETLSINWILLEFFYDDQIFWYYIFIFPIIMVKVQRVHKMFTTLRIPCKKLLS